MKVKRCHIKIIITKNLYFVACLDQLRYWQNLIILNIAASLISDEQYQSAEAGRVSSGRAGSLRWTRLGTSSQQHYSENSMRRCGWVTPRSVGGATASWPRRIKIFLALPTCSCYLWRSAQRRDGRNHTFTHEWQTQVLAQQIQMWKLFKSELITALE